MPASVEGLFFIQFAGDVLERVRLRIEQATLRLMADGKRNKEIGNTLGISDRTVNTRLGHLFDKLGVTIRTEAVKSREAPRCRADGLTTAVEIAAIDA